jgi:MoaA/NifB/PqqE/SkfB family radical SAM enzyme
MHLSHAHAVSRSQSHSCNKARALDFLWLELTNRCNLQCVHCYTESDPYSGDRDLLTEDDYASLMSQAQALGCRKIQFIGGEPQLNPDFQTLLIRAKTVGFQFIEVFSNLVRLDDKTVRYVANNGICFATSVYSDDAAQHDAVTKVKSSHARTIANLKRLIDAGVDTRAAIIVVDQDKVSLTRTNAFLRDLGVRHVSYGLTREFGRGQRIRGQTARLSGLCGHCWDGKLCIAPDGKAYPCVMARKWPVGNVLEKSLGDIVNGRPLADIRQTIFDTVWISKTSFKRSNLDELAMSSPDCAPNGPTCGPDTGAPDCAPELNPLDEPAVEECPQSCNPDLSTCGPMSCPQSCLPNRVE